MKALSFYPSRSPTLTSARLSGQQTVYNTHMQDDTLNKSEMNRRKALKLIAVTGVAASTGCTNKDALTAPIAPEPIAASTPEKAMTNPVLNVRSLPKGQP
ncbi:MAG TPA: hypothetical protein EYN06_05605, partial [Myxococcales bacterium]|nr:hypothetical protein [Myxococcales bacterium]